MPGRAKRRCAVQAADAQSPDKKRASGRDAAKARSRTSSQRAGPSPDHTWAHLPHARIPPYPIASATALASIPVAIGRMSSAGLKPPRYVAAAQIHLPDRQNPKSPASSPILAREWHARWSLTPPLACQAWGYAAHPKCDAQWRAMSKSQARRRPGLLRSSAPSQHIVQVWLPHGLRLPHPLHARARAHA